MNTSYYRGGLLPKLQSETNDYDPLRGFIYRATFRGLSADEMLALQSDYIRRGIACSITYSLGVSMLEVVDSTQQFTLDDWQLNGDEERIDIFSHPDVIATVNEFSSDEADAQSVYASIRQHLENQDDPATAFTDPNLDVFALGQPGELLQFYYSLYQRGTTEFENDVDGSGYVLSHSTNVSNRYQTNIADVNVGRVYSTAELLTEVQSSALWKNPLDARRVYKIANIPAPAPQDNYFWGWKKSRSSENTAANNRVSIQTHYKLALWSIAPNGLYRLVA
jgi:hypothetical protein